MRKFPLVLLVLVLLVGCSKAATAPHVPYFPHQTCTPFNGVLGAVNPKPGDAGNPHTCPERITTTTPPASEAQSQGPIGPASGGVEYVCYDQGGGAVIPAVTNSAGGWSCPSSDFPYAAVASNSSEGVGQVLVGYHFVCTNPNTGATYRAFVGPFELGGVSGYTGAYCPKAHSDWLSVVP